MHKMFSIAIAAICNLAIFKNQKSLERDLVGKTEQTKYEDDSTPKMKMNQPQKWRQPRLKNEVWTHYKNQDDQTQKWRWPQPSFFLCWHGSSDRPTNIPSPKGLKAKKFSELQTFSRHRQCQISKWDKLWISLSLSERDD